MSGTATTEGAGQATLGRVRQWLDRLETPTTTYYLLVVVTATLVAFGLVMVLSASSIESLSQSKTRSAFTIFTNQAMYAAIGLVVLLIARQLSVTWWRRLAVPALIGACLLQGLVYTPLGVTVLGNRNWIRLGPMTMQPSELIKFGLVLFGALVMDLKQDRLNQIAHVLVPYVVPGAMVAVGLVLGGGDLGTAVVIAAVIAATLWAAGIPARWFLGAGAAFGAMALALVLTSAHRLSRFDVWLGRNTDPYGAARQPMQGRFALADGGWFGLGLGQSREKWQWLPEPHNDFIFAIIGEELGLPGTLMVLALFGLIAYACYRLVTRTADFFVRVATAAAMAWIVVQALVNIGAVIGLLPVIGVPLPLVSSGGSSLVTTMLVLGMLMSFARSEPGCAPALAARPSLLRRTVAVVPFRRSPSRGTR